MFFIASKIASFVFSPLSWIVVAFVASILSKNKNTSAKLRTTSLLMLLLFTNPFLSDFVMSRWEIKTYKETDIKKPYDVAVVMGGSTGMFDADAIRPVFSQSVDRVLQSVSLYKTRKVKMILLTGGSGFVTLPDLKEAVLLKTVLVKYGVPDSAIITENESRNTFENSRNSAALLKTGKYGKRFLIVTSAIHVRRTMACFKKQKIVADAYPVDKRSDFNVITPDRIFIPNAWSLIQWEALIHEWIGFIAYKILGYC